LPDAIKGFRRSPLAPFDLALAQQRRRFNANELVTSSAKAFGDDQLVLAMILFVYSKETRDEMAYIHRQSKVRRTVYSHERTSQHLNDLEISRKGASTEGYQALL
jgi:hypothetical protein